MPVWVVKALAVGPGVVVSVVVVVLTLATAPGPIAAGAALVLAGVVAAAGHRAWEGPVVAIVLGARRLRPFERDELAAVLTQLCQVGLGPPLVDVRVRRSRVIGAMGAGRRTVIVSTGLIEAVVLGDLPSRQATAVVAHSAVLVREGLARSDLLIGCISAPWRAMRAAIQSICGSLRWLPLTQASWRLRVVVVAVAVFQAIEGGRAGLAVTIAAIGASSYAAPVCKRRWQVRCFQAGDRGVVHAGLGDELAAFLRTCAGTGAIGVRLRTLSPSRAQQPVLGLVRR